mmetsp:Transcript_3403/g.11802  ORF Transcript_3403/g.11802 Transcript_3403/m.11802 type:complete len:235 (+) Transcript_3403:757-1461(+)
MSVRSDCRRERGGKGGGCSCPDVQTGREALEAKRVHEVVGRGRAAVDVHLGLVELVQAAPHRLALRLHLGRPLGVLRVLGVALRLLARVLLALGLGRRRVHRLELLRRHRLPAGRLELLRELGEEVARVGDHELDAAHRPRPLAFLRDHVGDVRLEVELRKVFLHVGILRDRRGLGRCAVSERRSEQDLLQRLERIVGLCGENLVQCCHKVLPESVGVFDLNHVCVGHVRILSV